MVWFGLVLPIIYWPESPHQQQQHSTSTPRPTNYEPKGTPQAPFFIEVLPGPDAAQRAAQEAEDRLEKQNADRWLVRWTFALFAATLGLIGATAVLGVLGYFQLRDVRASINLAHRPKIRVKHLVLARDIWQGQPIVVNLTFVNVGTGQARINQIGLRYEVVRKGRSLPPDPAIEPVMFGTGELLPSGPNWKIENIDIERIVIASENTAIQQRAAELYCLGYVSYQDANGAMRITGFCRVLEFPLNTTARADNSRFRKFDDPDYEYED
jgi:hypothetical protein